MVGKWHLGHAQQTYHPNSRGFEHFYGHLHTEVGFFPPFASLGGKDFQRNGVSIDDQGYESYLLADEVGRYIRERDTEKPFFIYMPFIAPHTPLDAPEDLKAKYADMEDDRGKSRSKMADNTRFMAKLTRRESARPMYAAVVDGMDRSIGRVLDTLDAEGLTDNTIVLFFSDNGGAVYAIGGADNAPLRGGKGDTFEGGIRVVATMRWPEKIAAGGKVDSIMSVMDVFPTLLAAAGIEPQTRHRLDGRNLLPAIVEGERIAREDLLFFIAESPFKNTVNVTAFNDEWKLVQRIETGFTSVEVSNFLFDIDADPNEYQNLALEHPDVVAELADEIRHWRNLYPVAGTRSELMPPPGWRAPLDWADYPLQNEALQGDASGGMPPESAIRMLDWQYGENGRLIYNCEPYRWAGGGLCKSQ